MIRGYKYQLSPNENQKRLLTKFFGHTRFIYNYMLDVRIKAYQESRKRLSVFDLCKQLTTLKRLSEYEWLKEVTAESLQQSIRNMDRAFAQFFNKKSKFPKFKTKHGKQSCKFIQHVKIDFEKHKIYLSKIGFVNFYCDKIFIGKIGTVTVSKNSAGKYFASITVDDGIEIPKKRKAKENTTIGIDVGIKHFATLSTGEKIDNPKHHQKQEQRLSVLRRRLSKKQVDSNRRVLASLKMAKLYYKIVNQRKDFLHKLSSKIVAENQSIVIEDLNIAGMLKNHSLAKSISSASWSEFYRMLTYKTEWGGKNLIKIGRFEPSSKMCSCGMINNQLTLSDRSWTCSYCGVSHDRDILAAQNIKRFGLQKQNLTTTGWVIPEADVEMWCCNANL